MQTPARPFTVGGPSLAHRTSTPSSATSTSRNAAVQGNPMVVMRTPVGNLAGRQQPSSMDNGGRNQATAGSSINQQRPNDASSAPHPDARATLPRSTSAPHIQPLVASSSSPFSYNSQLSTATTPATAASSLQSLPPSTAPGFPAPASQLPALRASTSIARTTAPAPVPVNPKQASEARRQNAARSMRTSLVLLLAWYLITDSRLYGYTTYEIMSKYPSLRPLFTWGVDRILPLLLIIQASNSFMRVRIAPVPPPTAVDPVSVARAGSSTSGSNSATAPARTHPTLASVHKSSPKTRGSPISVASPALSSRIRPLHQSYQQSTPDRNSGGSSSSNNNTPSRVFRPQYGSLESPTASLHRALLASAGTPPRVGNPAPPSPQMYGSLGASSASTNSGALRNATPVRETASPRVQAYWARHEPLASNLHRSVSAKQDIDRLLAGEA